MNHLLIGSVIEPLDYGWLHDVMPLLDDYPEHKAMIGNDFDRFIFAKIGRDIDGYILRQEGQIIICVYFDNIIPREQARVHILIKRHAIPLRDSIPVLRNIRILIMDKYSLKKLIAAVPIKNKSCIVLTKMLGFKYISDEEGHSVFEYLA